MLRATIYGVVGPGEAIVYTDCHDGGMRGRGRPVVCAFLFTAISPSAKGEIRGFRPYDLCQRVDVRILWTSYEDRCLLR
jgi:hypothetical protein